MQAETLSSSNLKLQQILVTGSAGLVGKELITQLLHLGYKVKAIYHNHAVQMSHPNLEKVHCDILDVFKLAEVMENVTDVYHCAAIVSFDPKDKYRLLKINVEGTANVVNASINAGVKKIVHVSSVAAIGRTTHTTVTENMQWSENSGTSIYAKSKYLSEMEVWRGQAEGLECVIVNPTIILGGEDWTTGSSAIFKTAFEEFKWYTDGVTGFVDVEDVARAMILLMNADISGERFILNSENIPYRTVFSSIAKCFGKNPPYKKITPFLAELIWRMMAIKAVFTGKKHLLTKETVRNAQSKFYYDNSKVLKALPAFTFTKIEATIERTCRVLEKKYNTYA